MRIVGWAEWDDPKYKEMFPIGGAYKEAEVETVLAIIAEELRNNGYKFTGSYHQGGDYGVPVFDNGEVFQCSQRMWGGSIAHINLESNFPNTDVAWDMLNRIAKSGVIYFAFNTRINECKNHHGFVGTNTCPACGEPVFDTYQRIIGYLVPTRSYSSDRRKEFNTRQWYEYAEMMDE